MIRACIFDLDGTLTRTQESIARPVNRVLGEYGLPAMPVENFNYYAGDGLKNSLKRALADAAKLVPAASRPSAQELERYLEEGILRAEEYFGADPLYHVEPYPHVRELLEQLGEAGIRKAVFSNKPHAGAVEVTETIFGKGAFDHIQGQSDRVPIKPDPAGVFEILRIFGLEREECIYIGDTNTDMLTGHAAGVFTVGVTWGFRPREELEAFHADAIIDDPLELLALCGRTDGMPAAGREEQL